MPALPIRFDAARAAEYRRLVDTLRVRPEALRDLERIAARRLKDAHRYRTVSDADGIPWQVVAALHQMETSGDFTRHLHNGDPLSRPTTHVPSGRPLGKPPFTWEFSAVDALRYRKLHEVREWTTERTLWEVERYNGLGYLRYHPETLSPYLWAGSTHYTRGKYAADDKWDPNLVSRQIGAALILRRLFEGPSGSRPLP